MIGARNRRGGLRDVPPWNVAAGVACLAFFSPLLAAAYLVARAGGGPALVRRPMTRPDGRRFTALNFNFQGGRRGAVGRFVRWSRLDTMPLLISVARGDMALAEVFRGC